MNDAFPQLAAIQHWLQAAILEPTAAGVAEVEQQLTASKSLTPAARLAIYQRAYVSRLVECLEASYPVVRKTLGEELFREFAEGYIALNVPRSYNLNDYGRDFSQFLADSQPSPEQNSTTPSWATFLIQLAAWEALTNEVFDGPGEEANSQGLQPFNQLSPEQLLQHRFRWNRSLRLFTSDFPVARFWSAQRGAEEHDTEIEFPEPATTHMILYRRHYVLRYYEMDAEEFQLLKLLFAGNTLATVLERQPLASTTQLQRWFQEWTAQGLWLGLDSP